MSERGEPVGYVDFFTKNFSESLPANPLFANKYTAVYTHPPAATEAEPVVWGDKFFFQDLEDRGRVAVSSDRKEQAEPAVPLYNHPPGATEELRDALEKAEVVIQEKVWEACDKISNTTKAYGMLRDAIRVALAATQNTS